MVTVAHSTLSTAADPGLRTNWPSGSDPRGGSCPEWKYTRRFPDGPDELYHLARDPRERRNLAGSEEHAATQRRLAGRLDAFFARYAEPKYDLWHGGGSKTHLLTRPGGK